MKRYSEYKDSGVKWIGEIPGHWKTIRLRFLGNAQNGISKNGEYFGSGFPFITYGDVYNSSTLQNASGLALSSKEDQNLYSVKKGDIFFTRTSETIDEIGFSSVCLNTIPNGTFSGFLIRFRPNSNDLGTKYSSYYFRCRIHRNYFAKNMNIVIRASLGQTLLKNLPVIIPPLPEQEAIVTYLDSKVAKIDEYIAIAEKKIAALEELKQTIIAEAVTRGIHKDVPMKDSGVKWIGMIPEHWDLIRAQNMVDCRKAGAWGEDSRKDERDRICLRIADFDYSICRFKRTGDYTIRNYKQEQISSLYLNKGDILIEKSGGGEKTPVGRAILYDLDFYQPLYANFMEKITLREFASSSFYVYLLRTFYAKGCVWKYIKQTTGLQNLDLRAMLGSETFPVPPLPEQQEIVTYIEAKVANINQLCQAERSQIEKLKGYKQRLISDVVTGKVKVTND